MAACPTPEAPLPAGGVLVSNSADTECGKFHIDDTNNVLKIRVGTDSTASYEEVVLDNGNYSITEMRDQLQAKFDAKGLDVTVGYYGPRQSTSASPNGNRYSFYGLTITSNQETIGMKVEFDQAASTAYDTLFVKRTYTDAGLNVVETQGRDSYTSPVLTGGKIEGTDNLPLTIDGTNDSFQLRLSENGSSARGTYTIKMTQGLYRTVDDLVAEINKQIQSGSLNGKIKAVNSGGAIQFRAADGNRTVTYIEFVKGSNGYESLFVGKEIVYSSTSRSSSGNPPRVTLGDVSGSTSIDGSNDDLTVSVGGVDRHVTLSHGNLTPDQIAQEITDQLKGGEKSYSWDLQGNGTGTSASTTNTYSASGKTDYANFTCNEHGTGETLEGQTGSQNAGPAKYTVPEALPSSTEIGSDNDQIQITVNGTDYYVRLDHGTYTQAGLAQEIQKKLDATITSEANKVKVTVSGNRLAFETVMKGSRQTMSFGTGTSSFFRNLNKKETEATFTTKSLQSSIQIDGSNNTFSMSVNGTNYNVTLDAGTYDVSAFASMLQQKLQDKGAGVTVSASGSSLKFSTTEKGAGKSINLDTGNCGSAGKAMFGDQTSKTKATAQLGALPSSTSGATVTNERAEFTITLKDGSGSRTETFNLPSRSGGYTNDQIFSELRDMVRARGLGVTVSRDSYGRLTFTSDASGADVSLEVKGKVDFKQKTPDIKAKVENGKMVLEGSPNTSFSIKSSENSAFLTARTQTNNPRSSSSSGSIDQRYYTLRSNSRLKYNQPIQIDSTNKEFSFSFNTPTGVKNVSLTLDERTYNLTELAQALQEKLNAALGAGELKASVSQNSISFTAGKYGAYSMSGMSGGFYENVIRGKAVRSTNEAVSSQVGTQHVDDAYIVGRKDVNNGKTVIRPGVNDELSLDVTIDGTVHTLKMKLDGGEYSGSELVAHLQKKLDEQLKAAGLPDHSVLAGIGVYESDVVGANDKNALFFYINKGVQLEGGSYRIDGLKGSALFEIFYKTEGDLVPAYLLGTKDISGGVEVEDGKNTFSIDVDGVTYNYEVPAGTYTAEEFLDVLNDVMNDPNSFLSAVLSDNVLKLQYEKMGIHRIENFRGDLKDVVFNEIHGRWGYDSDLYLQIGANSGQGMTLERVTMSTLALGINSITISGMKYANKALTRLDGALSTLNGARSRYGADQNRLEYAIKGNENTAENLQASESRDRDTDMAVEIAEYAKSQVLQQTSLAVLTQANQQPQRVLALLQ